MANKIKQLLDAMQCLIRRDKPINEKRDKLEILVVDDKAENLKAARKAFGQRALYCSNVEEALHALDANKFDYVLTDLIMPKPSGYAPTRAMDYIKLTKEAIKGIYAMSHDKMGKEKELEADLAEEDEELPGLLADKYGPCGLDIAEKAIEKNMPAALVSNTGGHSDYSWCYELVKAFVGIHKEYSPLSHGGYNAAKKFAVITENTFGPPGIKKFKSHPEDWKNSYNLLLNSVKTSKENVDYQY